MSGTKSSLSQALTIKSKGYINLLPLQFLVTGMKPAGAPHSPPSLQTACWENDRSQQRVRILQVISPRSLCVVPHRERKLNVTLFFPFQIKISGRGRGGTLGIGPLSPRKNYCLVLCCILCLGKLAWQL